MLATAISEAFFVGKDSYGNDIENPILHVAEKIQPNVFKEMRGLYEGRGMDAVSPFRFKDVDPAKVVAVSGLILKKEKMEAGE
jgi:hypothetical protein